MPLTTINTAKDAVQTYQPLLLAAFTFNDGSVLRLSTHPLNVAEGGFQPAGITGFPHNAQDFFGRILTKDIGAVQAQSELGIDMAPHATLTLADADKFLWTNYEKAKGFKGAVLRLYFIFWDADSATFSTDFITKFIGVCDPAETDDTTLEVTATSLTLLTKRLLPVVPIQRRCPWPFPSTAAERQDGADNEDAFFYECGYSPDATGLNARGNLNGTVPFTDCQFTREACEARGMFKQDSAARITGRFGGINYDPPSGGRSREYVSGQWVNIQNNPNTAKYGDYYPMVYGTAWVEPPVLNVVGDGNSTRGEAVVCIGEAEQILKVVVNDVELPPATDMDGNSYRVADPLLRWNLVNRGDRNGAPNADVPYNGGGDPYGSLCAILWVVHRKVADAASTPRVRVLVRGPKIRTYSSISTFTKQYSDNPIWILMDVLVWTNFGYDDLDIQSFIDAAAICDQTITYTDQSGNASATRKRFTCSLVLRQRRSAPEIIRGIRENCGAMLVPNSTTGKVQVFVKRTLADQQPAAPDGTNYSTAVASKTAAGAAANGYAAYKFDESTILRRQDGSSTLRLYRRSIADSPNRVGFNFQDAFYGYAPSSVSLVDSQDVSRALQEVTGQIAVEGTTSYDHGNRRARVILAETHRGNPAEDTSGTLWFEIETSFRAVRVRVGQIALISSTKHGLTNQPIRITRIQPSINYETCRITGHWHDDDWYTDAYGFEAEPRHSGRNRDRLTRPAYPWAPYKVQPPVGDPILARTEWTFELTPAFEYSATGQALLRLKATGREPVNDFADLIPPMVGLQGTTATTGGNLAGSGNTYFYAVSAKDAGGKLSPHSLICTVVITGAGTSHTATIPVLSWGAGTTGWVLFGGRTPDAMTFQAEGTGTPTSITQTTVFNESAWGAPDGEFDTLLVRIKRVIHSGVWARTCSSVAAGQIGFVSAGLTVNAFTGYDMTLLALTTDGTPVPVADFRVVSNTADTLTVTPDPAALGIVAGDLFVMRSKPSVSGLTLTDANWLNPVSGGGLGLTPSALKGLRLRFFAGLGAGEEYPIDDNTNQAITVVGPWITTPDSTSRYVVEEASWLSDQADSSSRSNSDPETELSLYVNVDNYRGLVLRCQVFAIDGGGNEASAKRSPSREIYLPGKPPSLRRVTANTTVSFSDETIEVDTTAGNVTINLLTAAEMRGRTLNIKKISADANIVIIQPAAGDTIDGAASASLTNQWDSIQIVGGQ